MSGVDSSKEGICTLFLLTIMYDIPTELLQHIFALTIEPLHDDGNITPVGQDAAPWSLLRVCRLWENVALSSPELWSTIVVSAEHTSPPEQYYLALQLQRSENAPLDIILRMAAPYIRVSTDVDGGPSKMLTLVANVSARWRSFRISRYTRWPFIPPISLAFDGIRALPLLERVVVSENPNADRSNDILDGAGFLFRDSPRLHCVVLNGLGAYAVRFQAGVPWRQIRTYKAKYALWDEHVSNLVPMARTLVDADLSLPSGRAGLLWNDRPPLELPSLKRLVVSHGVVLDLISAPALAELHVCGAVEHQLPDFLARSACKIRRFTIYQCPTSARVLLDILGGMSGTLEHLALELRGEDHDTASVHNVLQGLTLARGGAVDAERQLCPHLASICWSTAKGVDDHDILLEMVYSRWRLAIPARKLRVVDVHLNSRLMRSRDWYELREEGLEVRLVPMTKVARAIREWREYLPVV
ncbi:F-box domain-containing protein [Mycena chlorophos]|uniref:F-box domain-containing protein n=1 Tax=Mycena chlorophos TaxID=658473 RepID=A0A8H6VUE7_MYCCL|nr:F-box domain-containing protein [Mycena chlorophos]